LFTWCLLRLAPSRPTVAVALVLGLAAYWGQAAVSVGSVSVDWFPFVAYGVASATASWPAPPIRSRRIPELVAIPLLAAALWPIVSMGPVLEANAAERAARVSLGGSTRAAVSSSLTATRLDPGRADYWNELGRGRFLDQDYAGSRAAFAQAVQLAPYSPTFLSNLAVAEAQLGATDPALFAAAIAHGRDAVAASPNDPNPHLVLAQIDLQPAPEDALTEAARTVVPFGTAQSADADIAVKIAGQLAETADPS